MSPQQAAVRTAMGHYQPLMAHARAPEDSATLAFASAIELARSSSRLAGRISLGLAADEFRGLLDQYFPGAQDVYLVPARCAVAASRDLDEFDDLVRLLLEHRSDDRPETRWLAYAITACCMGDDHLWQDMGLPNRQALSDLLAQRFTTLFAQNTQGMRWKKFFYRELCERNGAVVCRSPSCAACVEYTNCFGPEEDTPWQPSKR